MAKQTNGLLKIQKKLASLGSKIKSLSAEADAMTALLETELKNAAAAEAAEKSKAPVVKVQKAARPSADAKKQGRSAAAPKAAAPKASDAAKDSKKRGRPVVAKKADDAPMADPVSGDPAKKRGRPSKK